MDIIISAHFCPTPRVQFARVYKSDNILSVWGLQEEEEKGTFSYLCLEDSCGEAGIAIWQFTWLNTHEER